jgi:hypothetical protein
LSIDFSAKAVRVGKRTVHPLPGGFGESSGLLAERALEENGLAQERTPVGGAGRLPKLLGRRVTLDCCFEIDEEDFERRWTDDEVVKL